MDKVVFIHGFLLTPKQLLVAFGEMMREMVEEMEKDSDEPMITYYDKFRDAIDVIDTPWDEIGHYLNLGTLSDIGTVIGNLDLGDRFVGLHYLDDQGKLSMMNGVDNFILGFAYQEDRDFDEDKNTGYSFSKILKHFGVTSPNESPFKKLVPLNLQSIISDPQKWPSSLVADIHMIFED